MQYVIFFNGPPRVGKDTVANLVADKLEAALPTLPVLRAALSTPMRHVVYALAGEIYTEQHYDENKDKIHPVLGVTIRQAMIDLSEKHVKMLYGQDFWGRHLRYGVGDIPMVLLVSDLGFHAEAEDMITAYGGENVIIVRLYRDGKTWEGDSREYVEDLRAMNCAFHNHEGAAESVADQVIDQIKLAGWSL